MRVQLKLQDRLDERNLSHREFSRISGIRHPTISDMCNNVTKSIPLDNLAKICEVLKCDITDILELVPE